MTGRELAIYWESHRYAYIGGSRMPTTTPSHDRTWTPVEGIPAPRADGAGAGAVSAVERTIPLPARSVPVQAASARAVATQAAVAQTVPVRAVPAQAVPVPALPAQADPAAAVPGTGGTGRSWWSGVLDGLGVAVALAAVGITGTVAALGTLLVTATPPPPVPVAPASVSPNVSVPGRVLTAVDDGVWQVGVDVAPGTYASTGPTGGLACRHALRRSRTGGEVTASTGATGAAVVVLARGDGWFETRGCATWKRVG